MGIGLFTTAAGAALLARPAEAGELVGLDDDLGMRAIGVLDLAIAPGLIAAPRRAPWVRARLAANVVTAAYLAYRAREQGSRRAWAPVAFLLGVSGGDLQVAKAVPA